MKWNPSYFSPFSFFSFPICFASSQFFIPLSDVCVCVLPFVTPAHTSCEAIILNIDSIIWFVWSFISSIVYAEFWQKQNKQIDTEICVWAIVFFRHTHTDDVVLVCNGTSSLTHIEETEPTSKKPIPILFTLFKVHAFTPSFLNHASYANYVQCSADLLFVLHLCFRLLFHCLCPCLLCIHFACISVKMWKKIQTIWFTIAVQWFKTREKLERKLAFAFNSILTFISYAEIFFVVVIVFSSFSLLHHLYSQFFP